ncbi:hypothetical protein Q7P37_000385 [Cladosporium fusiforme]
MLSLEPDDQESLVRLLAHADQYTVEGLVATTSWWLNDTRYPDHILDVIDGYAKVVDNLNAHSEGEFPTAEYLRSRVAASHEVYGLAALQRNLSSGAELLVSAVDNSSEPLYVQMWGGAIVLAEALNHVQQTRSAESLNAFLSRVRAYAISDQDDAGPWMRRQFPALRYIVSIHGFNMYGRASWVGMSGEEYYYFDQGGPDSSLVSKDYIKKNFQRGPLGEHYIEPAFIIEGDTPALMYNMQNGLNVPEHPEYGGWGGRYTAFELSGNSEVYSDVVDWVVGKNNQTFVSNYATIWRWRQAYQNELTTRITWSLSSNYSSAAHPPKVSVNGSSGYEPLALSVKPGALINLDASDSIDTDSNSTSTLNFEWIHYREITLATTPDWNLPAHVPQINITCVDEGCALAQFKVPEQDKACESEDKSCHSYHILVAATGSAETPLTRYKRVILNVERNATLY